MCLIYRSRVVPDRVNTLLFWKFVILMLLQRHHRHCHWVSLPFAGRWCFNYPAKQIDEHTQTMRLVYNRPRNISNSLLTRELASHLDRYTLQPEVHIRGSLPNRSPGVLRNSGGALHLPRSQSAATMCSAFAHFSLSTSQAWSTASVKIPWKSPAFCWTQSIASCGQLIMQRGRIWAAVTVTLLILAPVGKDSFITSLMLFMGNSSLCAEVSAQTSGCRIKLLPRFLLILILILFILFLTFRKITEALGLSSFWHAGFAEAVAMSLSAFNEATFTTYRWFQWSPSLWSLRAASFLFESRQCLAFSYLEYYWLNLANNHRFRNLKNTSWTWVF